MDTRCKHHIYLYMVNIYIRAYGHNIIIHMWRVFYILSYNWILLFILLFKLSCSNHCKSVQLNTHLLSSFDICCCVCTVWVCGVCLCGYGCLCHWWVWRSEDNFQELDLVFHCGSGDPFRLAWWWMPLPPEPFHTFTLNVLKLIKQPSVEWPDNGGQESNSKPKLGQIIWRGPTKAV